MKILTLISGGDVGGAKTHVLGVLRALGEHITVKLVCFMEAEFTDAAREMGIDITILDSRDLRAVLGELRRMIAEEHFDLIHSHGSRGNFMATLLKKSTGLPLVSTVHSDWKLDYMGRPLAALTFGKLNLLALRRMDYLVGVSDSMSELLIRRALCEVQNALVQMGGQVGEQLRLVRGGEVHFGHEEEDRDAVAPQQAPERFRVRLDAAAPADDEHGAVQHGERPLHFGGKVRMSRRVQQRDLPAAPGHDRLGGKDRDAAPALQRMAVQGAVAVVDPPQVPELSAPI